MPGNAIGIHDNCSTCIILGILWGREIQFNALSAVITVELYIYPFLQEFSPFSPICDCMCPWRFPLLLQLRLITYNWRRHIPCSWTCKSKHLNYFPSLPAAQLSCPELMHQLNLRQTPFSGLQPLARHLKRAGREVESLLPTPQTGSRQ